MAKIEFLSASSAREDDLSISCTSGAGSIFLSASSAREDDPSQRIMRLWSSNFYPRPPRERTTSRQRRHLQPMEFLSASSAREDDVTPQPASAARLNFYPRPPRERTTWDASVAVTTSPNFYPRPPRERTTTKHMRLLHRSIFLSASSAREDDPGPRQPTDLVVLFLSASSAREDDRSSRRLSN